MKNRNPTQEAEPATEKEQPVDEITETLLKKKKKNLQRKKNL